MTRTFRIRARRFHALYELLTGEPHPEVPAEFQNSNHLRADVGLREVLRPDRIHGPLGGFPADPCKF